ncbi:MAG: hypothetical protein JW981_05620 [Anaerolineae bacterium]|nr:hypothetical protein [Anaerolineae bacterium]
MTRRITGVIAVLLIAGLLGGGAFILLNQAPQAPPPTPEPTLATVEEQVISVDYWTERYLVDQIMSHLAGKPSPSPRETLDRLINEALLLQAYPPEREITTEEVEQRLATLQTTWDVNDATLNTQLKSSGLSRSIVTHTVKQLLVVETAQRQLEATGADVATWLTEARESHKIRVDEALFARTAPPVAAMPALAPATDSP